MTTISLRFRDDWTQFARLIEAPPGAARLQIRIQGRAETAGLYDDISLTLVPEGITTQVHRGITRAFEPGAAGWELEADVEWTAEEGHGGAGALHHGWARRLVPVDSGRTYRLSYAYKTALIAPNTQPKSIYPFYVWYDSNGLSIGDPVHVSGAYSETWNTASASLTAPDNAAYLKVQLAENTGIEAWFDDVVLVPAE